MTDKSDFFTVSTNYTEQWETYRSLNRRGISAFVSMLALDGAALYFFSISEIARSEVYSFALAGLSMPSAYLFAHSLYKIRTFKCPRCRSTFHGASLGKQLEGKGGTQANCAHCKLPRYHKGNGTQL